MKKRLALVLAGVMMVSSLAGCGSSKPAATTAAAAASETTAAAGDAKEEKTEAASRYIHIIRNRTELLSQLTGELFRYSVILTSE